MNRYAQLAQLVAKVRPSWIVEIGVHRCARSSYIIEHALKYRKEVRFWGFDIFEAGDQAFHEAALNHKGIPTEERARHVLNKMAKQYGDRLEWRLIVGDTRQTLAGRNIVADLVFIDGDHRVETIRSDYEAVRHSRCIIFDDYLLPGRKGQLPDLDRYGANRIVDSLERAQLLPVTDQARDGWLVRFAMVTNSWCDA